MRKLSFDNIQESCSELLAGLADMLYEKDE